MQVGMLYDALAGQRGVNVQQLVCHVDDQVPDLPRISAVWARLAEQHPALRSVCLWQGREVPILRCLDHVDVRLHKEQHRGLPALSQAKKLAGFLKRDREQGIDLEAGPTWRLTVLVWDERSFSLVWTFHHLFLDGYSHACVFRSFLEEEPKSSKDASAPTSLAPPTQADHGRAVEERRHDALASEDARRFFRAILGADAEPPELGWSDTWPPTQTDTSNDVGMVLLQAPVPADTLARLETVCVAAGVTLSVAVHAAWGLTLARWSGRSAAVFGTVRSGRHLLPGAAQTIGCLINTVPIRVAVARGQTLSAFLQAVRRTLLALRPHENASLADIRRWCDLNATADLTDSTVLFDPMPLQRRLHDLLTPQRRVELHEQASSALSLMVYVNDDELDVRLEFDPLRVSRALAPRLLASFARLLGSMASALPQTPLAGLAALHDADLATLSRWSEPDPSAAPNTLPYVNSGTMSPSCVVSLIEHQARAMPLAPAVVCAASGASLTRGALERAADDLVRQLTARGIGPGDVVALCLPRGLRFVTALLAVMKSGAAWLPIDTRYPVALVQRMLNDSRARLLLTERAIRPAAVGVDVVLLDDPAPVETSSYPSAIASATAEHCADRPAYLIYTSGSSGQPKGVVVSHRALVSHAAAVIQAYGLQASDRVLQFASLSFDVSIEEIVPTLAAGAQVVLRDDDVAESVLALLALVETRAITVLNLPTAFWHTCVEQMHLDQQRLPAGVRLLIVGGEKASYTELSHWRRSHAALRWINAYGPTEATISCTTFELPPSPDVPIGRPLGHARVALIAPDGSLAPPGARGSLYLGGPCLADGYLGLPELTAERFPMICTPGTPPTAAVDPALVAWGWKRAYCTGDDARWDDAGQLHFLGRQDREVKVRGFRVDLRAVEQALERLPAVGEAVVRLDRPGQPGARLLAWILPAPGEKPSPRALAADLAHALPAHMRPAIRLVAAWPTTPGGKIDAARLPSHEPERTETAVAEPVPDEVRRMAAVFARVLQLDTVAPDDSFFDLGGHSLLALALMARIQAEFGCPVPIGLLKTHPTPAGLLVTLRAVLPRERPRHLIAIQGEGSSTPLYAIHGLGQRERLYRPLAQALGPGQPLFGLTVGYADFAQQPPSVEALAALYLQDIQTHRPNGPIALAGLSHSGYVAFELAQQLTRAGRHVTRLVLFDSQGPGGRPALAGRAARLKAHAGRLRAQGPTYLLERMMRRLIDCGGLAGQLGFFLARAVSEAARLEFDRPADVQFIHRLDQAVAAYRPAPYGGPVTIFYPQDDAFLDRPAAERNALGWRDLCTGELQVIAVPGEHVSMLTDPHVVAIAAYLSVQRARRE